MTLRRPPPAAHPHDRPSNELDGERSPAEEQDSPIAAAGTFEYRIDWDGDGSIDDIVSGPADPPVTHTYADPADVALTVVAVDKDGAASEPTVVDVVVLPAQTPTTSVPSRSPTTTAAASTSAPTTTAAASTSARSTTSSSIAASAPAPTSTAPLPQEVGSLPRTGSDSSDLIVVATFMALGGAMLVLYMRSGGREHEFDHIALPRPA
jgi:LPXTG-motif cell wall-anchored protein